MKKIILIIIISLISVISKAENIENTTIEKLLKENYVIEENFLPIEIDGNVYFILSNSITNAFQKDIFICKVPLINFNSKSVCKRP